MRVLLFLGLFLLGMPIGYAEIQSAEHQSGIYYRILDASTGETLLETGTKVEIDDEFLTENNRLYKIFDVNTYTAFGRYVRNETTSMLGEMQIVPVNNGIAPGKVIALYHSHTDEAYTPTDGTASIKGNGSIMKVGAVFAQKLISLGYTVIHDTTLHDPHNANAYIRSRRTVVKLLDQQPAALFDIHRNSAPASTYRLTIEGEPMARTVIVVGRANPYFSTTVDFAKKLKAAADTHHPKLIRGIFFANGHYNQDIHPRNILLEIGTEGSTLAEAQKGAEFLADAIPAILGNTQIPVPSSNFGSTVQPAPSNGGGDDVVGNSTAAASDNPIIQNILWLAGLVIMGGIAYLYISAGSWKKVRKKLIQLRNIEFTNLLGLRIQRKKTNSDDTGND